MICKGVNLIISGTGCMIRPVEMHDIRDYKNLRFYEESLGYCLLQITKNNITLYFLDEFNNLEYGYQINK